MVSKAQAEPCAAGLSGTLRAWWILGQEETASAGTSSLSQGLQLSDANTHTCPHTRIHFNWQQHSKQCKAFNEEYTSKYALFDEP